MMNEQQEDKRLKKLIERWTAVDKAVQQRTWEKIDAELFTEFNKKRSFKRYLLIATLTFATTFIIVFSLMTDPGQAVVQEIKDLFVTEKQEEIEIEGTPETTDVKLHANETLDYVIYIDEDRYKMEELTEVDRIVTKEPLGENFPDVYMEISQVNGQSKEMLLQEIKDRLAEQMIITNEGDVTEPVKATVIESIEKDESTQDIRPGWDTVIEKYYLIEVNDEQFFVIKQAYFQEAAEGHGARFYHMLESFEVVP